MLDSREDKKNNFKKAGSIVSLCIFLLLVAVISVLSVNYRRTVRVTGFNTDGINVIHADEPGDYRWFFDNLDVRFFGEGKQLFYISGWAVKEYVDSDDVKLSIVLKDEENSEYFLVPTYNGYRPDVSHMTDDEYDYDISGFSLHTRGDGVLKINEHSYRVCILYDTADGSELVETGEILQKR